MRSIVAIAVFSAMCSLISGCGCSKEKPQSDGVPERMKDAAYTNALVTLHGEKKAVAGRIAAIKAKIAALGESAGKSAEYVDLTNQLARCEAEAAGIHKEALMTVRARILKEQSAKKGNLSK